MTAIASAYEVQVLIGEDNQDWSAAYVSLQIGDPEWGQSGLLQITGKLVLQWTADMPESLDPRSSTGKVRFAKGQRVIINVRKPGSSAWRRHPRGWAYIARPPVPANTARPTLELDLVCCLEMRRFPAPKQPLLTPGQAYSIPTYSEPEPPAAVPPPNAVLFRDWAIALCLNKSGISNSVSTNISKYPTSFPLILAEDNFVDLAGTLAYGGICLLYQDNQGIVRSRSLAYNPNPIKTIRIGLDDCNYEPRQGSETPAEQINYNGLLNRWKDASGNSSIPDPDNPADSNKFSYQIEMGPGGAIDPALGTNQIILRETRKSDGASSSSKFSLTVIREPLGLMNPSAYPKITTLGLSSQVLVQNFYTGTDGRLDRVETTKVEPFFKAASEYLSRLSQSDKLLYRDTLVTTLTVTHYTYDDRGITRTISTYTQEIAAAIVKDQTLDNPLQATYSLTDVTTYREVRTGEWEKERIVRMPAARSKPDLKYPELDPQTRLTAKLALTPTDYSNESSNQGQQSPPATERAPLTLTTEPYQITGTATFNEVTNPYQPRSRDYTLGQGVTGVDQLTELAQITGATLIGRAQGAQIELPFDDDWINNPAPLQSISVIEVEYLPSGWRKNLLLYQVDAIEFVHQKNSAKVIAALIWQGTIQGSIVPYDSIPPEPEFSAGAIVAPYQSLSLDYQDVGLGSESLTSPPMGSVYTGSGIVIPPPPLIIQIAYIGEGEGIESFFTYPRQTDPIISYVGEGEGLRSNFIEPIDSFIGEGEGIAGLFLIASFIGEGEGLQSDFIDPIISYVGEGEGVIGLFPIHSFIGEGEGIAGLFPIHSFIGEGEGLQSDFIEPIDSFVGEGEGVIGLFLIDSFIGEGEGIAGLFPIDSFVGEGEGIAGLFLIDSFVGEGEGILGALLDSDAAALIDRFSGSYQPAQQSAISDFIAGLKSDGLWSTIDTLHVVAGSANQSDALLNWKSSSYSLSITGSLTYTRGRNFSGFSTTNYLSDGFVPSTAGGNFVQNSATIAIYSTGDGQSGGVAIGAINSGSTIYNRLFLRDSSNRMSGEMQSGSQMSSAANSIYTAVGLATATRTGSSATALYKNGTSVATGSSSSVGNQSVQIIIGAQNNNGSIQAADTNLGFVAAVKASGWTATQVSNFYSRLNTYLQSLKTSTYTFTYSSNGDTNGVFYFLGTNSNMRPWENPAYNSNPTSSTSYTNNAHIMLSASGYSTGTINLLTDRTTGTFQTTNSAGSWVKVDLGSFRTLSCDRYSIRHGSLSSNYLRNWKLQGSNDDSTWTDLDIRSGDTTIASANAWATFTPNQGITTAFRWFRLLSTGTDSGGTSQAITLGEWEIYGTLSIDTPATFSWSGLAGDQAGILYYLASTQSDLNWCNGWVHPGGSGLVTITASSTGGSHVGTVLSRITSGFYTSNSAGSWIRLDFGTRTVRVDSYQLRNYTFSSNIIRNWKLQGSNDNSTWTDLDIRSGDTTLTTASQYGNWTCNQGDTSFWRYVRILSTGVDSGGANYLGLGGIELYGAIL